MNKNSLDELLNQIQSKKNKLILDIEKEVNYLKKHNISIDIDINSLYHNYSSSSLEKNEYIKLKDKLSELNFLEKVEPIIKDIPVSNGSSYFDKINANIGIVADEFLFNSLKDVANFYYVHKDKYKDLQGKIDVLMIATAWRGLYNEWKGMGNPNISKMRKTIFEMIEYFRNDGVKIIFYSKEDPTNYEYFIDIAKKCDYIFTTAAEKVEDYKRDCNNENVFVMEFGVNPIYNNPIGIREESVYNGALFAGSWYKKYPHRQKDTRILFDGVIQAEKELKILDRNFKLNLESYFYPAKYLPNISPGIEHEKLQLITKLYDWVINLNTVKYSQTMFANRVYELQAMGNLLLSNYSLGINNYFPNIFFAFDKKEIKYIMQNYTTKELYQHRMFGTRQVLRKHTTFHRVSKMLADIGYDKSILLKNKRIAVVIDKKTDKITEMFNKQSYENKVLLTTEEVLKSDFYFEYLAFFKEGFYYGEYYIEDMINAFKYTKVNFVTKDSYYEGNKKIKGVENNYIDKVNNKYNTIFSLDNYTINELINDYQDINFSNGYSTDSLEFNTQEEPVNVSQVNKKFTVIIPTYNNGQHLYGKCFMSLRRSNVFEEMEIIIVDDGSKDNETLMIIDRLERLYSNVKVYKYDDGGSGSASRPRNKGMELATTNYITFLDPDNEAINDGYAKLYDTIQNEGVDLVIGNMKKCDVRESEFNYYYDLVRYTGKDKFNKPDIRTFLGETYFKAQSIQALMFRKELVVNNQLKMVEKAVGEDTLFFHQLLAVSNSFKVIDDTIHIYYAAVTGSAVNYITKETFQKYILLEKERIKFLKEYNLMEEYIDKRFNYYFKNWYLKKLEIVEPNSIKEASIILYDIFELYEKEASKNQFDDDTYRIVKNIKKKYL